MDDRWVPVSAEKAAMSRRSPVDIPNNSSANAVRDTGMPAVATPLATDGVPNTAPAQTSDSQAVASDESQLMLVKASSGGQKYDRLLKGMWPSQSPDPMEF